METKHTTQRSLQKCILIFVVLLFSANAFCADPNNTAAAKKSQPANNSLSVKTPKTRLSPSGWRPDMPLREALDILSKSVNPPLNIAVKWNDLEELTDITPDTPIGMNGLAKASVKTHLNVLLTILSTETAKLDFIVDGNVILIGVKESLPKKEVTRVYDIADIVAPPSMGGMMGMGMGMGYGMNGMGMGYGNMSSYGNMMGMGYGNMTGMGYGNQYGNSYNQGYMNQGNRPYGYQTNRPNYGIGMPMM